MSCSRASRMPYFSHFLSFSGLPFNIWFFHLDQVIVSYVVPRRSYAVGGVVWIYREFSCMGNFEARLLPANAPDSKWNIDNLPQSHKWWTWNINIFSFEYWRFACILCCICLNLPIFSICGMYIFRSKIFNNWYELIPFKLDFLDGLVEVLSTKLSL